MRPVLGGEVWPWIIDEIDARVRRGYTLPAAVLGVALHGPPPMQAAASEAHSVWSSTGDAAAALRALQHGAADPRVDRLCETAIAVHMLDGEADAVVEHLRSAALEDARRDRELGRLRSAARLPGWLLPLPVVVMALGGGGTAASAAVAACAVACACAAASARSAWRVRVFGTHR